MNCRIGYPTVKSSHPRRLTANFSAVPQSYEVFLRTDCPKEGLSKPLVVLFNVYLTLIDNVLQTGGFERSYRPATHVHPRGELFLVRGAAALSHR